MIIHVVQDPSIVRGRRKSGTCRKWKFKRSEFFSFCLVMSAFRFTTFSRWAIPDDSILASAPPEILQWLAGNASSMLEYHEQQLSNWRVKCDASFFLSFIFNFLQQFSAKLAAFGVKPVSRAPGFNLTFTSSPLEKLDKSDKVSTFPSRPSIGGNNTARIHSGIRLLTKNVSVFFISLSFTALGSFDPTSPPHALPPKLNRFDELALRTADTPTAASVHVNFVDYVIYVVLLFTSDRRIRLNRFWFSRETPLLPSFPAFFSSNLPSLVLFV